MIRAPFSYRIWFLLAVLAMVIAAVVVLATQDRHPWKQFQSRYHAENRQKLQQKIEEAQSRNDAAAAGKWQALFDRTPAAPKPAINAVYLPDAGVRDLCQTCHLGMENQLFADYSYPLKAHPSGLLASHKPDRFGCTLCHHGQGTALEQHKAHGREHNWLWPKVPLKFVQGLCYGCHQSPYGLEGAETAEQGRKIFAVYGCFGCHRVRNMDYLAIFATPLDAVGLKIKDAAWLYQWIKEPTAIRPHTRMPSFRLKDDEILHLTAYLASRKDTDIRLAGRLPAKAGGNTGETLFTDKGCKACHSVEKDESGLAERVPNLADAGLKMPESWIFTWIQKPNAWNPETAMPTVTITDQECAELTRYVAARKEKTVAGALAAVSKDLLQKGNAEEGKRLVQSYGCYGCHGLKEMDAAAPVGVDVAEIAKKRLDELPFGDADVAQTKWDWLFHKIKKPDIYTTEDMPLKMPDYVKLTGFGDPEITALTTFYLHNKLYDLPQAYLPPTPETRRIGEQGEWFIDYFNCKGCHQFKEDEKARIAKYVSLQSMVPPRLVDEGERVQPQWLFQFLSRPVVLRPWLKIRMPEFNWDYAIKTDMIAYLSQTGTVSAEEPVEVPYVRLPVREEYDPEIIAMGEYRVTRDKCVQCHPVTMNQELPKDVKLEDLSINLMLAKSRLRYDWLKKFLRNPDQYAGKGTKMPYVYYTPDGIPRVSDPEMWIEYSVLYLMFMDKAPEMPPEETIEEVRPGSGNDWTSY